MNFLSELPKPFFILAPMDDVTDTVFRQIVAGCFKPDMFFTEFVNVDGLQSPGRPKLMHKLLLGANEGPVIAQLWGLNPDNYYKTVKKIIDGTLIAEANELRDKDPHSSKAQGNPEKRAKRINDTLSESRTEITQQFAENIGRLGGSAGKQGNVLRFSGVDINMGCPTKTVIKNGACAALINNRGLAGEIIEAVQEAAGDKFPVSVKTRVGFTTVDMGWIEFLLSKKLNMLSIHGRTATQQSKVPNNWELIGQAREMRDSLCPSTLIVGNGDVRSRTHGLELAEKYSLDGIMLGRSIFHDPFAFAEQSPWEQWGREQKLELFKTHIQLHLKTYKNGERRFETLRKFCKVYINGFEGAAELRAEFMKTEAPEEALKLLG